MSAFEATTAPVDMPTQIDKETRSRAPIVYGLGSGILLIIGWELIVQLGKISPLLLPAPSEVVQTMISNASLLFQMSVVTTVEFLLGFFLVILVGIPLGGLVVFSRPVRLSVFPLLVAFQTIPKAAVAPIFIIWLGVGMKWTRFSGPVVKV